MKKIMKALGFLILIAVTYLLANTVITMVAGMIITAVNPDSISLMTEDFMAYNEWMLDEVMAVALPITVISNLLTIGLVFLYFLVRKDKFIAYVNFSKVKWSDTLLVMALGVFMNFIVGPLLTFAMEYIPSGVAEQYMELMDAIVGAPILWVILTTSIVAPLFEEILMRGIVFNDFKKAVPLWLAIVIQALMFGLMHMNIIQGTYAFAIGVVFGLVYYRYRSIWVPIAMHFAFNTTSLILDALFPTADTLLFYGAMLLIGIIGSGVVLFYMKKNYVDQDYMEAEQIPIV